jgi:hypothetical protein
MSSLGFADWQVVDGVCLSACYLQGPCVDWEDLSRQESTIVDLGLSKLALLEGQMTLCVLQREAVIEVV